MRGPKHIEGRVSRSILVFAAVAAALASALLIRTWLWYSRAAGPAPTADDPNSLRLQYVRPDYGRDVYDGGDEPIAAIPITNVRAHWDPLKMARQFVFTCRIEGDNPLFPPHVWLSLNGGPSRVPAWLRSTDSTDGWHTLSCESLVPRGIRRPSLSLVIFSIPRSPIPVRTVDAEISYFAGPRGQARATFTGPFQEHQTYHAEEDENTTFNCDSQPGSWLNLRFAGPPPMDSEAHVILYLSDGRRLFVESRSGSTSSSRGFNWTFRHRDVAAAGIAHITIGETPKTQTFRNIVVDYPDLPARTYPQSFDEIVTRLNLNVELSSPESIDRFAADKSFLKTPSDALSILDIAQGQHLAYAIDTLKRGSLNDLSETEQEQLRSILETWLETDREITACHMGLWAQWPAFIDRIPSVLRSGDLSERPLYELALEWGRKAPRQPKTLAAMTELLLEEDVLDGSACSPLVYAVLQGPEEAVVYMEKLAQCDKPWIWEIVIRDGSPFHGWRQNRRLSETVRARIVAMGMNGWIDDPESLKAEATAVLCSMLTPEYVQKGNVYYWSRQFEKFLAPEQGTEVLVRYLQAQLDQWHTWQVDGWASRNHIGVRHAVQQLNRWHNMNLGGLGSDRDQYEHSEHRFNWQNIIRETLDWAQSGLDPGKLPPNWQPSENDLRIVWLNKTSPELSIIALWPTDLDPNLLGTDTVMEMVDDYLQFTIAPQPGSMASNPLYDFIFRAGISQRSSMGRTLIFAHRDLPTTLDPGQRDGFSIGRDGVRRRDTLWKGQWGIWVESATATMSIIDDTALFRTWQQQYLSASPVARNRVFQTVSKEAQFQYIFDRRDYSGMSDAEIALRKAMDWDPLWPSEELKDYKEQMPRLDAVERYQELLQREDLPIEARIFTWSRIAELSRPSSSHPDQDTDPADNWETARHAFQQSISLDPNWVSPTTLRLQQQRTTFAARTDDNAAHLLDAYEWLLTRTEAMIDASVRRPEISRSLDSPWSMIPGASGEYAEREKTQLISRLSREIKSRRTMISGNYRNVDNPSDRHHNRWQRLRVIDETHWSHTYESTGGTGIILPRN